MRIALYGERVLQDMALEDKSEDAGEEDGPEVIDVGPEAPASAAPTDAKAPDAEPEDAEVITSEEPKKEGAK